MKNYAEALAKLGNRISRKIANNTYLQKRSDSEIAVKLHNTDILTFRENGEIVFNSGGWKTVTTKARMSEFSPIQISQSSGIWYVAEPYNGENAHSRWDNPVTYADGMIFNTETGKFSGTGNAGDEKLLRKQIRKFVSAYISALYAGKIPGPSGADCWICLMEASGKDISRDHLEAHLSENYFVPTLIVNAVTEFYNAPAAKWGLAELFKIQEGNTFSESMREAYSRALRRYLYWGLGLSA